MKDQGNGLTYAMKYTRLTPSESIESGCQNDTSNGSHLSRAMRLINGMRTAELRALYAAIPHRIGSYSRLGMKNRNDIFGRLWYAQPTLVSGMFVSMPVIKSVIVGRSKRGLRRLNSRKRCFIVRLTRMLIPVASRAQRTRSTNSTFGLRS